MKQYKSRGGFTNAQAQIYGNELNRLMKKNGGELTPPQILSSAKSKRSPLHDHFTWDDTEAAKKCRLHEARGMINSIVEVVVIEEKKTEQRSFFNVTNINKEKVYVTLKSAVSKPNYKKELLDGIIRHLNNTTQLMALFRDS